MNETLKEELKQEYLEELRKEPLYNWIEDNRSTLETEFINTFPPEDRPLDDDTPDFLNNYSAEFNEWAEEIYNNEVDKYEL